MKIEDLLTEYEPVQGLYLRNDKKAVAAISPDGTKVGFITIKPESKKYFENALAILKTHDREEVLPESEGMNAGRLVELIELSMNGELNA